MDKLCDTKKFTMADLVNWKPKTENTLRKKWAEKRKALKQSMEEANEDGDNGFAKKEDEGPNKNIENAQSSGTAGPRVKFLIKFSSNIFIF
jgi:hypothetical protein